MAEAIPRTDLERAMWILSSWKVEQSDVDRILALADAYAADLSGHECTVAGLPDAVKAEIEAAKEQAYAQGLEVGYTRGVAECVRKAAERPREPLTPWGEATTPGGVYQRADGAVWLFLGVPEPVRAEPVRIPQQRQAVPDVLMSSKTCTRCRVEKPKAAYSKDPKAVGGIRGRCKACESEIKADRKRRNAAAVPVC